MKEAIDATENTSEYVKGEIARKKAIHNKDMAELIEDEHDAYYQKVLDSSYAYDDLALGGERDLEKVRESSHLASHPSNHRSNSSLLQHLEEQTFPGCKHYSCPTCEP